VTVEPIATVSDLRGFLGRFVMPLLIGHVFRDTPEPVAEAPEV